MAARSLPHRLALALLAIATLSIALIALAPEGRLACDEPYVTPDRSPEGRWTLTLCRRPMFFAMPGGASDAPGWMVLRDDHGAIRGVSSLSMVQLFGQVPPDMQTTWEADRVWRDMIVELPLVPASSPFRRWLDDRLWRLRALAGFTPTDDFR